MKKFTLIALLLIIGVGILVLPASAQDDLTALGRYFPDDTPLFAAFRTDDDIIQTLDNLAAKFAALMPGEAMSDTLLGMLNDVAEEIQPGGTFETTFRSWLGGSAAIGAYELREQTGENPVPPITIAISITDQDEAETFFNSLPNAERYTSDESDGYTLYSPDGTATSDPYFLFRSDVVLITGDEALVEGGGELSASLSDSSAFTTAVGMLPADSYSAIAYADTPGILNTVMQEAGSSADEAAMGAFASILAAVQPQAFGLTILDNRSLLIDVAAPVDPEATGMFVMATAGDPIDPTFAQHILANTPLVIQGTNLYTGYQTAIENLRALAEAAPESSDMTPRDLNTALFAINFVVRGLTGMETDDALGWMTGDYALTLGFSPSFSDIKDVSAPLSRMPIEFGIILEATDPAAAQQVYDGLSRALDNLPAENVTMTEETLDNGIDALHFTFTGRDFDFPIELLVATGNGVFAVGTPRTVAAALNPPDVGLDSDPSYVEASQYFLADPNSLLFFSGSSMEPLVRALTASDNSSRIREQGKELQAALDLISSVSISASAQPDNSGSLTRIVWTLPE